MANETAERRICSFRSKHPHPLRKAEGCQFDAAPVYLAGDAAYCIFHMPVDAEVTPGALASEGFGFSGPKRKWSTEENEDFSRYLKAVTSGSRLSVRDFTGVVFPSDHFFRETTIVNGLFGECEFHKRSGTFAFIGTQFTGDHVSFQYSQFAAATHFTDAQFAVGAASFAQARFEAEADFSGCVFPSKGITFAQATFAGDAVFRGATLRQIVDFRGASFAAVADFSDCSFPLAARFRAARFQGPVSFAGGGENSAENRNGNGHTGEKTYDFSDAVFENGVTFAGRSFGSPLDLATTTFHRTPDFHGTTLIAGVSFPPLENFLSRDAVEDEARYASLKRVAAELNSAEDREKFWILEMAAQTAHGSLSDPLERLARQAYARFGLYGSSVVQPVAWLAGLALLAFPLVYFVIFLVTSPRPVPASLVEAFICSLQQTFQPFEIWRDAGLLGRAAPVGAELLGLVLGIVASVQSLATVALLVMAIIALRRRLKMT